MVPSRLLWLTVYFGLVVNLLDAHWVWKEIYLLWFN